MGERAVGHLACATEESGDSIGYMNGYPCICAYEQVEFKSMASSNLEITKMNIFNTNKTSSSQDMYRYKRVALT